MIKEDYVNFEQAKILKELGFPQLCANYSYDSEGVLYDFVDISGDYVFSAPTLYMAQKWLREEKGIFINIDLCCDFRYQVYLKTTLNEDHNIISEASQHSSYEEALSVGIDKALEALGEVEF